MIASIQTVGHWLTPIARAYIRYAPVTFLKHNVWLTFNWRERKYLARTKFGFRMTGSSSDLVQGYIYYFGVWEPNLSAWLVRTLAGARDRVFVDVGANVGWYSLLAASCLDPTGAVIAIEASPDIVNMLGHNVKLNGHKNVRIVQAAVTNEDRPIEFRHAAKNNLGASSIVNHTKSMTETLTVEGRSLASILLLEELPRIRVIKIDVEGAEWAVVQGLQKVLHKLPEDVEIVIEITPRILGRKRLEELFAVFQGYRFRPYTLENSYDVSEYIRKSVPVEPVPMQQLPDSQTDVLFSRRI